MNLKAFFQGILKNGISFRYSDGSAFDPSTQIRTDAIKDMVKAENERKEKCLAQKSHGSKS